MTQWYIHNLMTNSNYSPIIREAIAKLAEASPKVKRYREVKKDRIRKTYGYVIESKPNDIARSSVGDPQVNRNISRNTEGTTSRAYGRDSGELALPYPSCRSWATRDVL